MGYAVYTPEIIVTSISGKRIHEKKKKNLNRRSSLLGIAMQRLLFISRVDVAFLVSRASQSLQLSISKTTLTHL